MPFMSERERKFAEAVSKLVYCNPFTPERMDRERDALGDDFTETAAVWSLRDSDRQRERPNILLLRERTEKLAETLRGRLVAGERPSDHELRLYEDVVMYLLYYRNHAKFEDLITASAAGKKSGGRRVAFYEEFAGDCARFLQISGVTMPTGDTPAHLFAMTFQLRRAFVHIFTHIWGGSLPIAKLRASIWQSVVTHDLYRYKKALYDKMSDVTTLIVGPSGTGKELVARAIGLGRYIPFDPRSAAFTEDFAESFHPLNLSALSPTLIESELFGHRRGAFTGAVTDRAGWLEECPSGGTVFLDEIGELDTPIQVKLLRVLQTREFQRLGDTKPRLFTGKIIAATNKDLPAEMRAGRFRHDFYYRLCSDIITTPSLYEQTCHAPAELRNLIWLIARRIAGEEIADELTLEVADWANKQLGRDYRWPGNVRELEQCVRNVLIRKEYRPPTAGGSPAPADLAAAVQAGALTAEELLRRYCRLVYEQCGSYEEAARRLAVDRRTVKTKVEATDEGAADSTDAAR